VKITWKCRLQLAIYYNQVLQAEITRLVLNYFMRIILTHEQTDFDALASLLGASLLDEAAIPVMPRRMNRNVRAFMNLYGAELPFIDPRDLPEIPIREVTLVDTQSMITLKGMQADLSVKVIDHHPKRDDLPPDWVITTEMIGATATLFVEALVERNGRINSTYATLLLLGIYEDTGSLTYSRTTPRDLNAAAILLKHGASLKIATEFLNHPLSPQQQMLYDRLRADAETHHINGHTIILALGDAINIDEELSSIAHKIRDLLDPDAIFLIATIRGGVQMIARSSNDDIDVSQIVAHFGGGGHERAAAALIKDRNLVSIRADLLEILPRYVHPAVTVAQIMSRNPQLLTTETLAEDAASRMQRFGYEGYPVVEEMDNGKNRIAGLLTRRAVDRALSHKMNLAAGSLMDAGEVFVSPDDSIEHLQRLMIETGWGQIPVVDTDSDRIIGIVTRTDLLKILNRELQAPGYQNLASKLQDVLPPARYILLKRIAQIANEQHIALYIVGGFVRDLILNRSGQDYDLVVEGDAIDLARKLTRQFGGRVTSHQQFGTAKWHISEHRLQLAERLSNQSTDAVKSEELPDTIDLITARTEFYTHPTALPTVELGSIKLDLHRRDFTINTLALRLDGGHFGELHDYWGGLHDLRQGFVRVLHSLSFVDDPTRMLRAVRFEKRFGFVIEHRTIELLLEARPLLGRVSGDRIRHEINHILNETRVCDILLRLQELDLFTPIHKDLSVDSWLCEKLETIDSNFDPKWGQIDIPKNYSLHQGITYIVWFIRLPQPTVRNISMRLKIPKSLYDEIQAAGSLWHDLASLRKAPPSQIADRLDNTPTLALFGTYLALDDFSLREIISNYVYRLKYTRPFTSGYDLRALGVPPGPLYRTVLTELRNAWLDGKINSKEQEDNLLKVLLHEYIDAT
jgi:tRNA nucleotidyltransferase (CCA-adding enzyme)